MYSIEYHIDIEKALRKIPKRDLLAIKDKILELTQDPRGPGTIKLTGREAYRVRVGNYRIIYEIKDKQLVIIIVNVAVRASVYH